MAETEYAGDLSSREAWDMLTRDPAAVLIDVRTDAEWSFVGVPDLSSLGKQPLFIAWQGFPDMRVNENFAREVGAVGIGRDQTVLLICRSGQRSRDAAMALTAAGYRRCYNVADGFEGPCDAQRHRGSVTGWKVAGLPWTQR